MLSKITFASLVAAVIAQDIIPDDAIPTDPAVIASISSEVVAAVTATQIPDDVFPQFSSYLQSVAPTARVSDLPGILSSSVPEIEDLYEELGFPEDVVDAYVSAFVQGLPAIVSQAGLPGSASIVEIPGALSTAFAASGLVETGSGDDASAQPTGTASGNDTSAQPTTTTAPSDSTSDQSNNAEPAVSTGAAAAGHLGMVGWTGAFAGAAAGMVALL